MCGEAGQNRRMGILLRPIEQFRYWTPIRFIAKIGLPRFRASNDDAVNTLVQQGSGASVEIVEVLCAARSPRTIFGKEKS